MLTAMQITVALRAQQLLERVGFKFRAPPRAPSLFTEQAVAPYMQLFGLQDPDEVLRKAGLTRASLRELNSDDEITTALDTRREALLGVPWHLEARAGSRKLAAKRSEDGRPEPVVWVEEQFEGISETVFRAVHQALPFGYSVMEAVYKVDVETARVTWGEVVEKPFEWFVPKLDGTVLYLSRDFPQGQPVDPRKFFLSVREQTWRNPYGEALFSRLYWPWFFRQQGWRFWCKWLERFGIPLLIGKTQGDASAIAAALAEAVQNAAVGVGAGDDVQIAENRSGTGHFEGFERAVCARIQKLILGQTLTTDSGGSSGTSGSYALGKVHNEVREDRRNADVRLVTGVAQRMIDVLWALNGFAGKPPKFVMADDTGLELPRAERDAKLVQSGVIKKLSKDYLIRTYDYEEDDIVDEVDDPPEPDDPDPPEGEDPEDSEPGQTEAEGRSAETSAMPLPGRGGRRPKSANFAVRPTRFTRKQQAVEEGVLQALAALKGLPAGIKDRDIKNAIKASTGPDDLLDKLLVLLQDSDAETFRVVIERSLFAADLLGYAHAKPAKE